MQKQPRYSKKVTKAVKHLNLMALCLFALQGCMTPVSNSLTHVAQAPLWQAQSRPPAVSMPVRASYHRALNAFFEGSPPEVKKAFLTYQKTGKASVVQNGNFILFPFDPIDQPRVTCEPLHTCDITLEIGEVITSLNAGDTQRWVLDKRYDGEGPNRTPHALVKPKYPGLDTDLVITTTKRTYHIGLVSKPDDYIRQARFYYPREIQAKINLLHDEMADQLKQAQMTVPQLPVIDPANLDHHYKITAPCCSAPPPWEPLGVFNDGTHVFIDMPLQIRVTRAPVLFIQSQDGTQEIVNYRVKSHYYIVDQLFRQATLVSGVGANQKKTTLTYTG